MQWTQIKLSNLTAKAAAQLEDVLNGMGAVAVTLNDNADQPIFEPNVGETPLWEQIELVGLFEHVEDTSEMVAQLTQIHALPDHCISVESLQDQVWERAWMDQFHAMKFGDRLWVSPHHETPETNPHDVVLKLDPGVAFGTGTHATTHQCLEWLDKNIAGGERIFDFGCGSGILAIAALLLGAKDAWATDIDQQALDATLANAELNGINLALLDITLPEQTPDYKADVVVANILASPLISLAPTLAGFIRPGGKIAMSGILANQADDVKAAYKDTIVFDQQQQLDDWVLLSGTRR